MLRDRGPAPTADISYLASICLFSWLGCFLVDFLLRWGDGLHLGVGNISAWMNAAIVQYSVLGVVDNETTFHTSNWTLGKLACTQQQPA